VKICFCATDSFYGGINNNGGSRTIVLSAQTLRNMGHEAEVAAVCDNLTWFEHQKIHKKIPKDCDACIACSVSDVADMLASAPAKAKKLWWCRLLEDYQMPKSKIIKTAKKVRTIVNSEGLKKFFSKHGVKTEIVYQGIDDDWNIYRAQWNKPTIGFLISNKKRKNLKLVRRIIKKLGDSYDYAGYGSKNEQDEATKKTTKLFKYFRLSPDHNGLVDIYNKCDIWCSVSDSEGLHNPPMEAALCGCELACYDTPLGGTCDYANKETAWLFKDVDSAVKQIKKIDYSKNVKCRELIYNKIGTREQNMKRLLNLI